MTQPAISDDIEVTVDALCELTRRRGIEFAVDIGRTILEGIYDGDITRLRARIKDCPSLRALAAHPRIPLTATALHHAIHIYLLVRRLPAILDTDLTPTHLKLVLPLPEDTQADLLRRTVAAGWTTDQLAAAIRDCAPRGTGGRPRLPRVVKTLHHLDTLTREPAAWADLDDIKAMPPAKQAALLRTIEAFERQLHGIKHRLSSHRLPSHPITSHHRALTHDAEPTTNDMLETIPEAMPKHTPEVTPQPTPETTPAFPTTPKGK